MSDRYPEIGVGVIGFGTVGTGTVKLLQENAEHVRRRVGAPVRVRRIADLDLTRDRGVAVPEGVLTDDGLQVVGDPDVQIVVELVGGTGMAREFLLEAIRQGKSVVTANKALLAEHGPEIARAALDAGVDMGFEATVGGGIPIIRAISVVFPATLRVWPSVSWSLRSSARDQPSRVLS